MEVVDVKLMEGYPRAQKCDGSADETMPPQGSIKSELENEDNEEAEEERSSSSWILNLIQNLAILVFFLKIGEYLLKEAIIDEALNAD